MEMLNKAPAAAKWLDEQGEELASAGGKLAERTSKFVVAHPLQALGLALAAGYLISRLTR